MIFIIAIIFLVIGFYFSTKWKQEANLKQTILLQLSKVENSEGLQWHVVHLANNNFVLHVLRINGAVFACVFLESNFWRIKFLEKNFPELCSATLFEAKQLAEYSYELTQKKDLDGK